MDSSRIKKGYFLLNGKKYVTRNGVNLIGRNKEAAVIIKNASISQHHALLVILDDDKHYLSDFNSSNGTFLDSVKLPPLRLYEIKQGASVQFADVHSTYCKMNDNSEVNTQESESSQVNDTARTQLLESSIACTRSVNKLKQISHISDHGYTKLWEYDENYLYAPSTSTGTSNSPCTNYTKEVEMHVIDGGNSNSDVADKTEEKIQGNLTTYMDDHGYYEKSWRLDIHDMPTPVKNKKGKSSLMKAIHDLPTQIMDGFDNDEQGEQGTSIHELPTQMIHLPDALEMPLDASSDFSKVKVTQKSNPEVKLNEQTHDEPLIIDESILETKCNEIIDETLPDNLQQEQNSVNTDENSTDSIDFMESVTQHFANNASSEDFEKSSQLHVSQQNRKVRNIITSDDENDTDSDSSIRMSKVKQTKKKNVLDSSQETEEELVATLVDDKVRKARIVFEDSDSETDVSKDGKVVDNNTEEPHLKQVNSDEEMNMECEPRSKHDENAKTKKVSYIIEDSGSETDVETDILKNDGKASEMSVDKNPSMEFREGGSTKAMKVRASFTDSDSETDVEIDVSIDDDKAKPCSNEMSVDKNTSAESRVSESTKTMKVEAIFDDSDSETDVEINVSRELKASDADKDNSQSNDNRAGENTVEIKINLSDKNDLDTEKVRRKKNAIELSDDTDIEDEISKTTKENSYYEIIAENANLKSKANSEMNNKLLTVANSSKETDVNVHVGEKEKLNNKENAEDNQQDLLQSTKIDENKKDEDKLDNNNESINMNLDNKLDDTDVIPATQNSFVGEINFDFNTQDLIHIASKLEKARKENLEDKIKSNVEDTINSEESLGDSFKLALTNSIVRAAENSKHQDLNEDNSTVDLFFQAMQTDAEVGETLSEKESIFLKPPQNPDFKNNGDADDDEIFIQPTQQLPENQGNSKSSKEIFLQPQITITEKCLKTISKDDSIFIKPTQKLLTGESIEGKLENVFRPTQPNDDSIFLEATQKLTENEEQDKITQVKDVYKRNAEKTTKSNQAEDNIFMQVTQVLTKEDGEIKKQDVHLNKKDDIFMEATQILPEVQNGNQGNAKYKNINSDVKSVDKDIFVHPMQVVTEELKAKSPGHSVESQLEVMFASQNVKLIEDENPQSEAIQKLTETVEHDEVTFLKPAQVKDMHKSRAAKTRKPNQVENDIFMQITQVLPEEDGEINKQNVNLNKEDDDIFMQATQIEPEVQNDNQGNAKSKNMDSDVKLIDKEIFVQPTQVVTEELKEKSNGYSVESQLEVMFASQNVKLIEDENLQPGNPTTNLLNSLETQPEVIEITDDLPEGISNKGDVGTSKKRSRTKSTDNNDVASTNKPKRSNRKSPQLSNNPDVTKRSTRSTENTSKKAEKLEVLNEEDKLDLIFKLSGIMENDVFSESTSEPVGAKRQSPQPVVSKAENSKLLRKKTKTISLATVKEKPELPSKPDIIPTPLESKVSAGQQLEEEGKLQSKKRNVKFMKCADNLDEEISSYNVEAVVKSERNTRQKAKKNKEIIEDTGNCTDIHEIPLRSSKRARNNNVEIVLISDSSNDSDVPFNDDLPNTSKRTLKDTKKSNKSKDNEEVGEEKMPGNKSKIKSKTLKFEDDQKNEVKEKKQRTKRTNSAANDETEEKPTTNVKRTRLDPAENKNSNSDIPKSFRSETASTSKRTRSRKMLSPVTVEEDKLKPETDTTSDDEFAPSVAKKKRKDVLDSDSDDVVSQSSTKNNPGTPTRKKLLQIQAKLLSTPERLKRKLKPKIAFTMLDSPELESLIRSLGGSVVNTIEACTVLVTTNVKRSQKLLSAVGLGKPICSPKWLQECKKAGNFLDPWDHILVDDEAETKWHFSLKESLQRSVETKLLENYIVHLIVNNAQDVLKDAIESCGGKCVTRAPPKNSTANYVIVSTPENKSKYTKFLKQSPQPMIVAPEAIFDGVLRQELHFEEHKLS